MALERTCNYIILGGFAHAQSMVVIGKLPLPSLLAIGATFFACIYSKIFSISLNSHSYGDFTRHARRRFER